MSTKQTKKVACALVCLAIFAQSFLGNIPLAQAAEEATTTIQANNTALKKQIDEKLKQGTYFLLGIKNRLARSQAEQQLLTSSVDQLSDLVANSKKKILTLQDQLDNLDGLLKNNEKKALSIRLYIAELNGKIAELNLTKKSQEREMSITKKEIGKILQNLYLQAALLYTHDSPEERIVSLLAYNTNLNELNQKKQYAAYLNEATNQLIANLETESDAIQETKDLVEQKQAVVLELQNALNHEAFILNDIREARARLLAETQGKQELYEDLLKNAQKEEVHVSMEVEKLKENYSFFEEKLNAYRADDSTDLSLATLNDISSELKYLRGTTPLAWPVSPSLGISAFYHDSEYHAAMKAEHQAVDIRALQGTDIRAAADGVVSKTVDNGFGYSYIILTHPGKILTLYGHVSEIDVKEGQIVRQGQVIGLSGGMPGTKGAGWMTTGPHLHFETFQNFKHVDPLTLLPLEFLPKDSLESKYVQRVVQ